VPPLVLAGKRLAVTAKIAEAKAGQLIDADDVMAELRTMR
jgi:hypothetical protein